MHRMKKINAWIKLTSECPRFLMQLSTHNFLFIAICGLRQNIYDCEIAHSNMKISSVLPTLSQRRRITWALPSLLLLVIAGHLHKIELFGSCWTCPHPVTVGIHLHYWNDFLSCKWSLGWLYNMVENQINRGWIHHPADKTSLASMNFKTGLCWLVLACCWSSRWTREMIKLQIEWSSFWWSLVKLAIMAGGV